MICQNNVYIGTWYRYPILLWPKQDVISFHLFLQVRLKLTALHTSLLGDYTVSTTAPTFRNCRSLHVIIYPKRPLLGSLSLEQIPGFWP